MEQENNDYKKYFDPKEYITKVISVNADSTTGEVDKKESEEELLTALLTDTQHKDVKENALLELKKNNKGEVLLKAIAKQKDKTKLPTLIAACWESEIEFSKYLPFFVLLAIDEDYMVSIEAITVISEMQGPFEADQLVKAIAKIKEAKQRISDEKQVLLNDLLDKLTTFL